MADAEDRGFPAAKTKMKASGVKAGGVLFISACAVGCLEKVVRVEGVVFPGLCGVWCRPESPENGVLASWSSGKVAMGADVMSPGLEASGLLLTSVILSECEEGGGSRLYPGRDAG